MSAFVPAIRHMRTEAERHDQVLSWQRPDERFFASGACHILALRFLQRHEERRWVAAVVRPRGGLPGSHVYATDGTWAFDFNGWVPELQLLDESATACRARWPGWGFDRIVIDDALGDFPFEEHDLRRPEHFHGDPCARADDFLDRFAHDPPPTVPGAGSAQTSPRVRR